MEEIIQLIVKTYGIVGLVMLSPFVAVVYQWRHNLKLNTDHTRVQEQRVKDAQAISDKLLILIEEQAGLNKETNIALDQVRELLMKLTVIIPRK